VSKALTVDQVTVAYDRTTVLRDVSAKVEPGRILAVTGPSGAGKTTLLWAMAGLVKPVTGTVAVNGTPLRSRDHAVAESVVLVPQDNGLAPILTAGENVQVALVACGIKPPEARRRTAESLEALGLSEQVDQLVEELSGGQQQRTALARGLALRGDVLLARHLVGERAGRAEPAAGHGSASRRGRSWRRGGVRDPRPRGRGGVRRGAAPA